MKRHRQLTVGQHVVAVDPGGGHHHVVVARVPDGQVDGSGSLASTTRGPGPARAWVCFAGHPTPVAWPTDWLHWPAHAPTGGGVR